MVQWSQKAGQMSRAVRAYVSAAHPTKTAETVAAVTRGRVSASAWRKAEQRGGGFSAEALLALVAAYGPGLLAAALPGLGWLSDAARAERQRGLEAEHARLTAELARLSAEVRR